ncbi:MAG: uroporphyrinogen-III synthase [Thiomargarita sp.]|nr:uroporphyrinogen-III synthase [Thiomargarita sp.]
MSVLTGLNILITRPAHQAEHLCQLISAEGGHPVRCPVIEIIDIADKNALHNCCDTKDFAIFISTNAVEKTLFSLGDFPQTLPIISVGKRTAETLKIWGLNARCAAPPFNSESVLALPELQEISGKQIVIFRGEGGRELLADTLRKRGAIVTYINVYRRIQPTIPDAIANTHIDIITVTSVESLHNFFNLFEEKSWITTASLVVMSTRVYHKAEQMGLKIPLFVAPNASDEGLLNAVLQAATSLSQKKQQYIH